MSARQYQLYYARLDSIYIRAIQIKIRLIKSSDPEGTPSGFANSVESMTALAECRKPLCERLAATEKPEKRALVAVTRKLAAILAAIPLRQLSNGALGQCATDALQNEKFGTLSFSERLFFGKMLPPHLES